jgi:hypothetical protein
MIKFKIYRAIAFIFFLFVVASVVFSIQYSAQALHIRVILSAVMLVFGFVCYGLMISIFNYFKQQVWKKISIVLFIAGNMVYNILINLHYIPSASGYAIVLFYLPLIIAFVSMQEPEIKPLATLFGYIELIICVVRIAYPYSRSWLSPATFGIIINILFCMPSLLRVALFHKMVIISKEKTGEDIFNDTDLLQE